MEKVIEILVCNGNSPSGRISWLAAQELVLEGKAVWHTGNRQADHHKSAALNLKPFILVDGCDKQCLLQSFPENQPPHYLDLTDLGIDPDGEEDISRDDIDLAKDGIIAECAPVGNYIPQFPSGCCC